MNNMKNKRMELLAHKWLEDRITPEEVAEFNSWYSEGLDQPIFIAVDYAHSDQHLRNRIFNIIEKEISKRRRSGMWLRAVAAVFAVMTIGVGIYLYSKQDQETVMTTGSTVDIPPGSDEATLVLGDGRRIVLSDAENGKLANQGGVAVSKTADGQLVYRIAGGDDSQLSSAVVYNSIETPQGGQYQVLLPDGTRVWLNAASSFRYPTAFPKSGRREVQLTYGEAYFEVSPDVEHPFVVATGRQQLEVLGTRFNVNAYPEDPLIKTTLLAGKVKVTDRLSKEQVLLRPGQQAQLDGLGIRVKTLSDTNLELWKDGKFTFDNEPMRSIMQQIARWYKVRVVYEDPVQDVRLTGSVSRFDQLSTLLQKLEQTGLVRFKREGDRLIVMKP